MMSMMRSKNGLCLTTLVGLCLWLIPQAGFAEVTRHYTIEGFEAMLDGNPETTALTQDGGIVLAPVSRDRLVQPESSFSAATAQGRNVVVARVDESAVVVVNQAGKEKVLYKAKEGMITDLLSVGNAIYVATGPSARIYRINKSGKAKLFFEAEAEHIWDMTPGPKGSIFCVTGGPGQVIQIDAKGKGRVLLESEQTHLRSVLYHREHGLFVGGGERGVLLHARIGSLKKFRALYDTLQREVTSLVVVGDYVYVVGVSGAEALASEGGRGQKKGKSGSKPKESRVSSQLAEVALDGTAQILAGSNDEVIFSVVVDARGDLLVSTGATGREDPRGRIYSINPRERVISLVYQSPSRMITHLLNLPGKALAAVASGGGRITQIVGGYGAKGEYISAPFDIHINARFGAMDLLGEFPAGSDATLALRTGQTAVPDETWSEWSAEISKESLEAPKVQNGRYAQLRVTLKAGKGETPTVHRVRVAYLRKNLPPFVSDVFSLEKGIALVPLTRSPAKTRTINLREKKPNARGKKKKSGGMGAKAREVAEEGALTLRWRAEDPNDDELRYGLDIRRSGNRDWQVIDDEMEVPFYTLQSSQLPDGHYRFRVRASDALSNPVGLGLEDERESFSILIDNQPPEFTRIKTSQKGTTMTARVVVSDSVGPLTDARFSLDGQRFQHLLPDDGVLDGRQEAFTIRLEGLDPGPHTLTVRVLDSADNEAVGESVFEMK